MWGGDLQQGPLQDAETHMAQAGPGLLWGAPRVVRSAFKQSEFCRVGSLSRFFPSPQK